MFSLWSILGGNYQEDDSRNSEEMTQFNRLLQESQNYEEILLNSQLNSAVESRTMYLEKFLKKEGVIESILEILVSTKDSRLATAAAKVMTSKFQVVRNSVPNNEKFLNILFQELLDFSTCTVQQNPENHTQISNVMVSFLLSHKWEILEFVITKISKDKMHLIFNYPSFLIAILDQDFCSNVSRLTTWISEINLVSILINRFTSGEEYHREAADALIQITSFESRVIDSISKSSVEQMINASVSSSEKLDLKWYNSQMLTILSNLVESSLSIQAMSTDLLENLIPIVNYIPQLVQLVDDQPSDSIENSVGIIQPFGMMRMNIIYLIGNLLHLEKKQVHDRLLESNFFSVILNLVFKYKWNNILHTKVVEIFEFVFSSYLGFETNLLSECNLHETVAKHILECHNAKLERNEILPYTSILEKLSNLIISYAENTSLDDLEESENWKNCRKVVFGEEFEHTEEIPSDEALNDNGDEEDDDDVNVEISSSDSIVVVPEETDADLTVVVVDAVQGEEEMKVEDKVEEVEEKVEEVVTEVVAEVVAEEEAKSIEKKDDVVIEDQNPPVESKNEGDDSQVESAETPIVQQDGDIVMAETPKAVEEDNKGEECN